MYLTFWWLEKHRNRVGRKRFQLITFLYSIFLISAEALTVSSPVSVAIRGRKQITQRQTWLLKSKCTSFGSWIYCESGGSCFFPSFFQAGQTSTKTTPLQSLRQHRVYQSQEDGECGAHGVPTLVSQQEFCFYPFSVLRQPHVDPGVFGAAAAHPKAGDANEVILVSIRVVTHQGAPAVALQMNTTKTSSVSGFPSRKQFRQ